MLGRTHLDGELRRFVTHTHFFFCVTYWRFFDDVRYFNWSSIEQLLGTRLQYNMSGETAPLKECQSRQSFFVGFFWHWEALRRKCLKMFRPSVSLLDHFIPVRCCRRCNNDFSLCYRGFSDIMCVCKLWISPLIRSLSLSIGFVPTEESTK